MKKNMGNLDRMVRVLLSIVFAVLFFTGTVSSALGMILLAAGGVFLATSVISFCPLYTVLGINTPPCNKKSKATIDLAFLMIVWFPTQETGLKLSKALLHCLQ